MKGQGTFCYEIAFRISICSCADQFWHETCGRLVVIMNNLKIRKFIMKKISDKVLPSVLAVLMSAAILLSGCERYGERITAEVIDHTGCKSLKSGSVDGTTPDTLSCINYVFEASSGTLQITHINAGFNCCPGKLTCHAEVAGDTLFIKENEQSAACSCNCLFDVNLTVRGLESREYIIQILEPYCGKQEKLIAHVNLAETPAGSFCATRKLYPWGIMR
jgi:hypothetical protein